VIWLAWQNSDLTLREVGLMFGGMGYTEERSLGRDITWHVLLVEKIQKNLLIFRQIDYTTFPNKSEGSEQC
jgi:hypothetical protein